MTFLNLENKVNHSFLGLMHINYKWTESTILKWQRQGHSQIMLDSTILKGFFFQLTNLVSIFTKKVLFTY